MLPCPDIDGSGGLTEGTAHTDNCGATGQTVIGRLPWRTLGTDAFADGSGSCLWYVVSGSYKDAGNTTAAMINPDSNGQLQLHGIDTGALIAGARADERPIAMIIAPMEPIAPQSRLAPPAGARCSSSFAADAFLDMDSSSGTSNATLSGVTDGLDVFAVSAGPNSSHNDRVAWVTRSDLEQKVSNRHDFDANMRVLGRAVTACVAEYARNNSGGTDDRRLPWPAPMGLSDYRPDAAYDDEDAGNFSGRLPDVVGDSTATTGNSIDQLLSNCDPLAVPEWSTQMLSQWRNWKDHFFYAVAPDFAPSASVPNSCGACLSVDGSGAYSAIVIFANSRITNLSQLRNAPPMDADTRDDASNYLEGVNAALFPFPGGAADFTSQPSSAAFNDILFCIDPALVVSEC